MQILVEMSPNVKLCRPTQEGHVLQILVGVDHDQPLGKLTFSQLPSIGRSNEFVLSKFSTLIISKCELLQGARQSRLHLH